MKRSKKTRWINGILCLGALMSVPVLSGCQVSVAGQTLPSGYYFYDDLHYNPKGPEFKLSNEAAALKAAHAEAVLGGNQ